MKYLYILLTLFIITTNIQAVNISENQTIEKHFINFINDDNIPLNINMEYKNIVLTCDFINEINIANAEKNKLTLSEVNYLMTFLYDKKKNQYNCNKKPLIKFISNKSKNIDGILFEKFSIQYIDIPLFDNKKLTFSDKQELLIKLLAKKGKEIIAMTIMNNNHFVVAYVQY